MTVSTNLLMLNMSPFRCSPPWYFSATRETILQSYVQSHHKRNGSWDNGCIAQDTLLFLEHYFFFCLLFPRFGLRDLVSMLRWCLQDLLRKACRRWNWHWINWLKLVRADLGPSTYLQFVLSLKFPSSSSEACLLGFLLFVREFAVEDALEDMRDWAFFETVFPLSSAWRLKSCILTGICDCNGSTNREGATQSRSSMSKPCAGYQGTLLSKVKESAI